MNKRLPLVLGACAFLSAGIGSNLLAADAAGTWHSEFESQRGHPKYTFTFKPEGPKLSGKAKAEVRDQKREVDLKEGKVDGETVSFGELLSIKSFDMRMP